MERLRKIIAIILLCSSVLAEGEYDWIADHIVIRTTEKEVSDSKGILQSVVKTEKSTLTISQTLVESKKRNKQGLLVVTSRIRTTVTTDTDLCTTTVIEKELLTDAGLTITQVTKTKKTARGTVTTVESLNSDGLMEVVKRTTVIKDEDGMTTTTVETLNKDGQLIVRQTIKSY